MPFKEKSNHNLYDCSGTRKVNKGATYEEFLQFQEIYFHRSYDDEPFLFSVNGQGQLELLVFENFGNTRPTSFKISDQSKLYKHIIEGNARHEDRSFMNPVPNLIKDTEGNIKKAWKTFFL